MSVSDSAITARYDRAAPRWSDKMHALGYARAYRDFIDRFPPQAGSSVIDVGCGTGAFVEAYLARNPTPGTVQLLDPSERMLRAAQEATHRLHVEATLVQGVLGAKLDAAENVLAAHVLEHCPDPVLAMKQLADLTTTAGQIWLVVSKPHWCNAIIWLQWRHRTFDKRTLQDMVLRAGLHIEDTYSFRSGPPSRTSRGFVLRKL